MLNGIDVSSWQGDIQVQNMDLDFVIVKATGGIGYINPYCDKVYQRAKKAGKLLGFYHYAHEIGLQGTAVQEAEFFVKQTKNYFGEAIPILDWESDNKHDVKWALDFLNHVYTLTGVKPLFYSYTAVVNTYNFRPIALADYGLWIANYGKNNVTTGFKQPQPPQSNGWPFVAMYQYNSRTQLAGYNGLLDANVFYGDRKTWLAYARIKNSSTTSPSPSNGWIAENGHFKLNTAIKLRKAPSTSSREIATIGAGAVIIYDAYKVDTNGYVWIRQKRGNGYGYMATGTSRNGKRIDRWGSFY